MKKRNVVIVLVGVLLCTLFPTKAVCLADTTYYVDTGYAPIKTIKEALELFESDSSIITQINTSYEIKEYEYQTYQEKANAYKTLYETAQSAGASEETVLNLKAEYLEALRNAEALVVYHNNKDALIKSAIKQKKYEVIVCCYQLMLLEKKMNYYQVNSTYLNALQVLETKKYKKGSSTKLAVNQLNAQILENDADLNAVSLDKEELLEQLQGYFNGTLNFRISIVVNTTSKSYQQAQLLSLFEADDFSYEEAISSQTAYTNYRSNMELVAGSTAYQYCSLLAKNYGLQAEQITKELIAYRKKVVRMYRKYTARCSAATAKRAVLEEQFTNLQQQYKKGKVAKIKVLEAAVNLEAAELNYDTCMYDKNRWEYVMEQGIYGISI
ncbi:hypothetical protein [Anaeromicropila populeti]|uniref:Outer membrane efflux protein n=1 Tax=Anaeromicropila populeti TaxID=37658 RepID=A0A1I6JQ12_9FIRM|nr:hypothetical protein [Anaeromicropila populeti]SFR81044.1 hypothetical protein SAMN05661086_01858 [Anaeromicropila populeti]